MEKSIKEIKEELKTVSEIMENTIIYCHKFPDYVWDDILKAAYKTKRKLESDLKELRDIVSKLK